MNVNPGFTGTKCHCDSFELGDDQWVIIGKTAHTVRRCGEYGQLEGVFSSDHLTLTVRWRDGRHKTIEVLRET